MDIRKTYILQANLYLNSSIVVLIPATFFILLFYPEKQFMVLISPFLIYSLYLFQHYLLNKNRFMKTSDKVKEVKGTSFLECNQFFLILAKEEKALMFYHVSGQLLGKIIQIKKSGLPSLGKPKEFKLVDEKERTLASYFVKGNQIEVYLQDIGYFGSYSANQINNNFQLLSGEMAGFVKIKTMYMDVQIENAHQQLVCRIQKGLMPLESQALFMNPNTPIITLDASLPSETKLLYLSLLVKTFF